MTDGPLAMTEGSLGMTEGWFAMSEMWLGMADCAKRVRVSGRLALPVNWPAYYDCRVVHELHNLSRYIKGANPK